jgi:glycosyltransferase involved in cell wall biosynthesis
MVVSFVTPSFNHAQFLERTFQSGLSQDYPNLEYLNVDGVSNDGSVEIIKEYTEQLAWWVSEKDRLKAEAINKGFKRACGDIAAWINSDDLYYDIYVITHAVQAFQVHPAVGMVCGDGVMVDPAGFRWKE